MTAIVDLRLACQLVLAVSAVAFLSACASESSDAGSSVEQRKQAERRQENRVPIAVTFDDVPSVGTRNLAEVQAVTTGLLTTFEERRIPVAAFVNSAQLDVAGEREARLDVLGAWLNAGHELANHTHKHPSLHRVDDVELYLDDIRRCEMALHQMLGARGKLMRYFRHPYLHTGLDLETKDRVDGWLAERGYAVAPVTLENFDWMFSSLYDQRLRAGDTDGAAAVAKAYLEHTEKSFDFLEKVSLELNGEPHAQVLLLHANRLNADHFGAIADIIERRGYRYATLEEALEDEIYRSEDRFAGPPGPVWQYRWAETAGVEIDWSQEPEPPAWIVEAFEQRG